MQKFIHFEVNFLSFIRKLSKKFIKDFFTSMGLVVFFSTSYSQGSQAVQLTENKLQQAKKTDPKVDALEKMQSKYKNLTTLSVEFTQFQKNIALGSTKESSGRIYIRRPNMFRWETLDPTPSILVGNGRKVWYYTPALKEGERGQVVVRHATQVQSKLAIDLLAGQSNIKKDFNIKKLEALTYELTPLKPAGDIDHIELTLEQLTNLVYKLVLFTKIGNQTELRLKNMTLNPKLGESMFNFTPPPNTEEIR